MPAFVLFKVTYTLLAERLCWKMERQGGMLAFCWERFRCTIVSKSVQLFRRVVFGWGHVGYNFGDVGSLGPHLDPKRAQVP